MTKHILIIDLEATCWEGAPPKGQQSEIIEIGIALLNSEDGNIVMNKSLLIKPVHSTVSPFCTELTTITQEQLDKEGIGLEEAFENMTAELHAWQYTWASYGAYDRNMMQKQAELFGIDYPMSEEHINVKQLFAEKCNAGKAVGMARALQLLNIPLEGTHHRGVDDAKNIAKIFFALGAHKTT